jgi:ABC-2 type transport system ATP-binding protein
MNELAVVMAAAPPMLEIRGLCVRYEDVQALDNLSLSVQRGDIYGLIGPNGAGKTTTFKVVATLLQPDAGSAIVDGLAVTNPAYLREIRAKIGYMPDSFGLYEDMTAEEYLSFFAAAYGIDEP